MAVRSDRSKAPPGGKRISPMDAILSFVQWLPPWMHEAGTDFYAKRRGKGYQIRRGKFVEGYVHDTGRPRLPNVLDFLPMKREDEDCSGK